MVCNERLRRFPMNYCHDVRIVTRGPSEVEVMSSTHLPCTTHGHTMRNQIAAHLCHIRGTRMVSFTQAPALGRGDYGEQLILPASIRPPTRPEARARLAQHRRTRPQDFAGYMECVSTSVRTHHSLIAVASRFSRTLRI